MPALNPYLASMPAGYLFREVAKRIDDYQRNHPEDKVISLGIGDVTRPLSAAVTRAMASAALEMGTKEGFRGYGPEGGYPFLIKAIYKNLYEPRGVTLSSDEIFVSDGAKSDTAALQQLLSSEARIAVTDPVYPVYIDSNAMTGRAGEYRNGLWSQVEYLPCTAENGFVPPLPQHYVDAIYLCFPNNPTGVALTLPELQRYVDWAVQNGVLIFYDAAYSAFITSSTVPHTIYECRGAKSCAIECGSFSKLAGFTGVRCGYTIIPKTLERKGMCLNDMWVRNRTTKTNGVSYIVQCGAAAVFSEEGQRQVKENLAVYRGNAKTLMKAFDNCGIWYCGGENAPYIWFKCPNDMTSWECFDLLLNEKQIIGTPGVGFGKCGEGYFRLSSFGDTEETKEAAKRIIDLFG